MKNVFADFYKMDGTQGFDEQKIIEAEKRLDITFPDDLRNFYLKYAADIRFKLCLATPEEIYFSSPNSDYLIFHGEEQGVCCWAVNKNDFDSSRLKIYISFDSGDFIPYCNNLDDFFLVKILGNKNVFPFIASFKDVRELDKMKISKVDYSKVMLFGTTKDIQSKIYEVRENEFICLRKYHTHETIIFYSQNSDALLRYKELFPDKTWNVFSNSIKEKVIYSEENHTQRFLKNKGYTEGLPF